MKKTYLSLIALLAALQFSYAQWVNGTGTIYTASDKVGIGTTSPAQLLHVTGSGAAKAIKIETTSNHAAFVETSANSGAMVTRLQSNSSRGFVGALTNNGFDILSNGIERISINADGNVGIGTTTVPAGYKLAVNGAAIATLIRVKPSGSWPDFVFLKDYKLPTLTEVKTYIDKNQHLSDMPSADEVHKNGLDLGEMNRLLLKKVEELTLYLIEKDEQFSKLKKDQQEKNDRQQAQLEELKAAVSALKAQYKK